MKIYLASRYSRREELCHYRRDLEAMGHRVTARWLDGGHQVSDAALPDDHGDQGFSTRDRRRFAEEDWADLMAAEVLIAFTEQPRHAPSRGGRHVELGAALAAGKTVILVGPRENVFCCLPQVIVCATWDEAMQLVLNASATGVEALA